MANKNLHYELGDGRVKEITSSYYDDVTGKLFSEKLIFNSASLQQPNGVAFFNNGTISSSNGQSNQVLLWDQTNNRWQFTNPVPIDASVTPIPANSDLSGTFLGTARVRSLSNVTSGTLPIAGGGTGMGTADFQNINESLLVSDGGSKFKFQSTLGTATGSQIVAYPLALASFTSNLTNDQSIYANTITIGGGTFVAPPSGAPFSGNVLRSLKGQSPTVVSITPHIGDFTVEGWAYFDNGGSSGHVGATSVIFGNSVLKWFPMLAGDGANALTGFFSIWDGSAAQVTTIPFQAARWYHIALTRSGNDLRLYANATGSAIVAAQGGLVQMTSVTAGTNETTTYNINGYISDMAFYTFAKTQTEIQTYYNAVLSGSQGRRTYDSAQNRTITTTTVIADFDDNGKYITGSASDYHGIKIPSSVFNYY